MSKTKKMLLVAAALMAMMTPIMASAGDIQDGCIIVLGRKICMLK